MQFRISFFALLFAALVFLPGFNSPVYAQACDYLKQDIGRATSKPQRDALVAEYRRCVAANNKKKK